MATSNGPTLEEENDALRHRIEERRSVVRSFIAMADDAVQKRGTITSREQTSSNTHIVRELVFEDFLIVLESGYTMMGGSSILVTKKDSRGPNFDTMVFSMSSDEATLSSEKCEEWKEVRIGNASLFEDLNDRLMRRHDIFRCQDEAKERERVADEARQALIKEHEELVSEAKRLGLPVGSVSY